MDERMNTCLEEYLYGCLHDFLMRHAGGLLPNQVNLEQVRCALDVACGSGEWILDMAWQYPQIQFVGLDTNPQRMSYARAVAKVRGVENVNFVVADMLCTQLPAAHYDLVHGRLLSVLLRPSTNWMLCAELLRLCAPGGYVILCELCSPRTNSAACTYWFDLLRLATQHAECLTEEADHLPLLLKQAGCHSVDQISTLIDISYATPAHTTLCTRVWDVMEYLKPLLLRQRVISPSHLEQLCVEALMELGAESFAGQWPFLAFKGRK